jgi:hypothetical protein
MGVKILKSRARRGHLQAKPSQRPPPPPPIAQPVHVHVDRSLRNLPGIDLRLADQRVLLAEIASFYEEQPFAEHARSDGPRYYFENDCYSYSDALCLYGILRRFRPTRLIEVGAGFTSALVLDVRETFLDGRLECTLIEPYPERYLSLCRPGDDERARLHARPLQEIDAQIFGALQANDVLLIDSSHVDAPGSDVRRLLGEILPSLRSGVLVHFHDMFWPFEYPDIWSGAPWNEIHAVRRFLEGGAPFEIVLWNELLARTDRDMLEQLMPLALRNTGGSLWLRKI